MVCGRFISMTDETKIITNATRAQYNKVADLHEDHYRAEIVGLRFGQEFARDMEDHIWVEFDNDVSPERRAEIIADLTK